QADPGDPGIHRPGPVPVRDADLRPVPAEALSRRHHLVRDRARGGDQRRRLRPQGARHLLDGRAVVRAAVERASAGSHLAGGQLLLQEIVTSPRGPRRALDARTARLAAADLLSRHAWTTRDLATRLRRRGAPADVAGAAGAPVGAARARPGAAPPPAGPPCPRASTSTPGPPPATGLPSGRRAA